MFSFLYVVHSLYDFAPFEVLADLPKPVKSGLKHAKEILSDVKGIEFVQFETVDVVRHTLVQKIIESYEKTGE